MAEKMWGDEEFWGLGYDWDPDWVLTEKQVALRTKLIGLCENEMRANAKRSDDELLYPKRNFEILGENGFLALTVPEEYGGLGENHVCFAMVVETIARYGCASTAMCYVMHMSAVNTIMLRPTPELIEKYIRPLNTGKIGTLSYSDPETGSHFFFTQSLLAPRRPRMASRSARRPLGLPPAASPTSTSFRQRALTSLVMTTSLFL